MSKRAGQDEVADERSESDDRREHERVYVGTRLGCGFQLSATDMKIDFEITKTPLGEQWKYPKAYIEGRLQISVDEIMVFDQPGILLIEFASFVRRWLNLVKSLGAYKFVYETMDHDEPIFVLDRFDGSYKISSIWQETDIQTLLSEADVVTAFENYLIDLTKILKAEMGLELSNYYT